MAEPTIKTVVDDILAQIDVIVKKKVDDRLSTIEKKLQFLSRIVYALYSQQVEK